MEREEILFAQALGEVSAARRNVELANERLAIAEARLREAESAILTDICNQSAEALKPLGDSE